MRDDQQLRRPRCSVDASQTNLLVPILLFFPNLQLFPISGALDRPLPARVEYLASIAAELRLEELCALTHRFELRAIGPESDSEAREQRRTQSGDFEHGRPLDPRTQDVGLKLHQEIVLRGTPIDTQHIEFESGIRANALHHVPGLIRNRLQRRAHDVIARRPARDPDDGAPSPLVPIGRTESHESGDQVDATGIR